MTTPRRRNASHRKYFSYTELRARGWTPRLIEQELGAGDLYRTNPADVTGPPRRFWRRTRVEGAERDEAFLALQHKREDRRQDMPRPAALPFDD